MFEITLHTCFVFLKLMLNISTFLLLYTEKIKRQGDQGCRKLYTNQAFPLRKKVKTERNPVTMGCISLLKVYYTRKAKATDMKFPYIRPKEYINLALIRRDNLTKRQISDVTTSSIHGNIDDILDATSKSKITMEEVALPNEDGSLPTFILILGAPGVGKSIFAWKLAQQWAKGVLLQDYSIVILLRARDSKVQNATKLVHLLYFIENVQVRESLVKDITEINGSGVLFILDGYDELYTSKREFFDKFLRGEVLPGATVLVTSRPSASDHILKQCSDMSQHIEILGFTKKNIWSYAVTAMPDRKMLESFNRYLSCYHHIHSAMYIPLNCVFVIQMYKENWEENENMVIVKTMSELYTSLVRSHLLRDRDCKKLKAIENVPNYDKFLRLCLFAYESILKNKVVFSDDELPPGLEHFSLMQTEQELYIDEGCLTSYNFIHLTMQEYLAAFHVSKLPVAFQKEFVKEHIQNKMLNVVIKFIAGLTKLHEFDESSLRELVCPMEGGKRTISTDSLHILFESQDSAVIECTLNEDLVFRHVGFPRLTPYDYHVLGFCIANSLAMWDLLLWTEMSQESATMFSLGTLPVRQDNRLKQVVKGCGCTSLYMQGLCKLIPSTFQSVLEAGIFTEMTSLSLRNAGLDTETCIALSKGILNLHKLEHLDLDGNPALFAQGGEEHLVSSLIETNTIQSLLLELTSVRNGKAIANLLKHCTSLSVLDCDANKLNVQEAKQVLMALQNNVNMRAIALSEADLSGDNCELLAHVLKNDCHNLRKLYVNKCCINSGGAVQIAEALCINKSLQLLHMSTNRIGKPGAESFAEMLKNNHTLTKLMISDQSMGKEGVQKLMDSLSLNSTLEMIDLPNTFEPMWKDYVPRSTLKINWIYENHSFSMAPN